MDILLIILGSIFMLVGLVGCVLPIIPGPPISYVGLLLLQYTEYGNFSSKFLWIFAGITIAVTILDYIIPIWGTKKFGGSKAGVRGATIGLILGLFFFPPIGLILGPFLGAFIAEMRHTNNSDRSFRSALGSLVGFLLGTGLKLISSAVMAFYFVKELI